MSPSLSPSAEARRIAELHSFGILDTPRERPFDVLVRRVATLLEVPIVLISLVDRERQWFKGRVGSTLTETPRDISFCSHTIALGRTMVVEDATVDERFMANPLVVDSPSIRFYVGAPLVTSRGNAVGALCAIDHEPRTATQRQITVMERIAAAVVGQIEMRTAVREINAAFADRDASNVPARTSRQAVLAELAI